MTICIVLLLAGWMGPIRCELGSAAAQQDETGQTQARQDQTESKGDEDEPETADDYVEKARDHAFDEEYDKSIGALEKALELEPKHLRAKSLLVLLLERRAQELKPADRQAACQYLIRAAALIREIVESQGNNARVKARLASYIFDEACCYAVENKAQKALDTLRESFEWGFDDVELARTDEELKSLVDLDEFKSLIEEYDAIIRERMAENARREIANFDSYEFDFDLVDLDGNPVTLADYEGKVLIVDFWGTWCGPCIQEIPSFIALKKKYGKQGLDVVGIAYEHSDDAEENVSRVKASMEELNINYNCMLGDDETREQIPEFSGFPTTLFIDRHGKVRLEIVGLHRPLKLEAIVLQLLEEDRK